ncbi:MAG: hypothetical protein IPI23_06865 [Bacteroidetes bacterium]|nr:hypothetical protein [Bacteroidota bacterium]
MVSLKKIRGYENLHILLWLLKDTCWVMLWEIPGLIMIIPTIGVAFHITWFRRHVRVDLFHNLAVCCWISANSIWMIGEFFFDDKLRIPAMVLFVSGLITVAYYYISKSRHPETDQD